jgi:sulfoacetaldehyde dehydrogenase
MVIDETANIEEAAHNSMLSKMSDFGSGCSADGNLIVEATLYEPFLKQLQKEGGYLVSDEEKKKLEPVLEEEKSKS